MGAMEIEGTQIFEEEEANTPVAVPIQTNVKSDTIMVLEAAAATSVAAPLAKQSIAWFKEDSKLRRQPTQGSKKLLLEILKDAMNRKLVQ